MLAEFLKNNNIDVTLCDLPEKIAGMYASILNRNFIILNNSIEETARKHYTIALSYFCIVKKEPNKIMIHSNTKEELEALAFADAFFMQRE